MKVKVIGPGCKKCQSLEEKVRDIINQLGIRAEVEKVRDLKQIIDYGVLLTPALVIDGEVKVSGRIPNEKEIIDWLQERAGKR
ncbi:MAG: thioredoxin family protein [bacterium]